MVLSPSNRQIIESLAEEIRTNAQSLGADALARLFEVHPQTKTYFSKFSGFKASDKQVKDHGARVMKAVVSAIQNLDNLSRHLEPLADKHGEELLVAPQNFKLFSNCIVVTLARNLALFPPSTHCAVDKFLELLEHELSSKYR